MRTAIAIAAVLCIAAIAAGAWLSLPRMAPTGPAVATWDAADPQLGAKAYAMCQACHGVDGRGVPGYAPPLAGSRWLTGDPRGAILIALHGFDATSEAGSAYVSARMLGHGGQLADHEIAGLLSWARRQWGNAAPAMPAAEVAGLRARFAARAAPWSPAELRAVLGAP